MLGEIFKESWAALGRTKSVACYHDGHILGHRGGYAGSSVTAPDSEAY